MSVTVIYYSRKGNTRRVAEAMASALGTEAVDISVSHTPVNSDVLIVGMGIYAGKPDQNILSYIDNLPVNRIKYAGVFSTSASGKDRMETAVSMLRHKGITIHPKHLNLRGSFLWMNRGRPDEKDMHKAVNFAEDVVRSAGE